MATARTAIAALLAASVTAAAQSNVSNDHKFAWQENIGWSNWRDAGDPPGREGVVMHRTYLSGSIWLENAGWVSVGRGVINGAAHYANASGEDSGVNVLPKGDLAGFAWGENIGWVCFDTGAALGRNRARFDAGACRLRGFAWSENVGWLNLDDVANSIGIDCYADCNGNCELEINDFICYTNRFAAGEPYANCDGSTAPPALNVNDFVCFLNRFAIGCPQ